MGDEAHRIPSPAASHELYAGDRAGFVERRTLAARRARDAGDRDRAAAITAMRKPSTAAHLVNLLAHDGATELDDVIDLGTATRAAIETGDAELRTLLRRRSEVVARAVRRAGELAAIEGVATSATVEDQVARTLRAAMASPAAAVAVAAGTLVDALDEPDVAELASLPARPRSDRPRADAADAGGAEQADAEQADAEQADAEQADAEQADAEQAAARAAADEAIETAVAAHERATAAREDVEQRREALVARLAEVDAELDAAVAREAAARRDRDDAERARRSLGD